MQLIGAVISEYKSLDQTDVPLEGLTVLFGPNGAGKTNVIEALAMHDPVARARLPRLHGHMVGRPRVALVTRFDTSANGVGPDADVLLEILATPWVAGVPQVEISEGIGAYCGSAWWLYGGDLYDPVSRSDLPASYSVVRSAFMAGVPPELQPAANELLDLLFEQPLFLVQEDFAVELSCDRGAASAQRLVPLAEELSELSDGTLSELVAVLRSWTGRWPPLMLMSRGPGAEGTDEDEELVPSGYRWVSERLGGVQVVSGDVDTIEQHLDLALETAHDRLLHRPARLDYGDDPNDVYCERCLHPNHGGRVDPEAYSGHYPGSAEWLEERNGWIRVRPSLLTALGAIEAETNSRLPAFVIEQGQVRLEIRPVPEWDAAPARCRILFAVDPGEANPQPVERDGAVGVHGYLTARPVSHTILTLDVTKLGAGLRRWIATTVRLASDACAAGEVAALLREDVDDTVSWEPELIETVELPSGHSKILVVDEPEQHLHPHAQEIVAAWASEEARRHHAVVVATHSAAFLALPPERATICQVQRIGHQTHIRPLPGVHGSDAVGRARQLGFELGLGRAALGQLTRAVVVVEGDWDRALLLHFFGDDLLAQRLLVVPLQGSDELLALADAAVIPSLGLPVFALLDEVRAESLQDLLELSQPLSKAERGLRDLAKALGERLHIVRYEDPDVICALPEVAVRAAYPGAQFPGWDALLTTWRCLREAGVTEWPFKRWALEALGVSRKNRFPSVFFSAVLEHSVGIPPSPRFRRAVQQLLAAASADSDG